MVDTDASTYRLGCAIHQTTLEGDQHSTGHWSRLLVPAERYYSAQERKRLAVVSAMKTLRRSFFYEESIVHTDHGALWRLLWIQELSGRSMRRRFCRWNITSWSIKRSLQLTRWRTITTTHERRDSFGWSGQNYILSLRHTLGPSRQSAPETAFQLHTKQKQSYRFRHQSQPCTFDPYPLFATISKPTAAYRSFNQFRFEEFTVAQVFDALCIGIRQPLNKWVVLSCV